MHGRTSARSLPTTLASSVVVLVLAAGLLGCKQTGGAAASSPPASASPSPSPTAGASPSAKPSASPSTPARCHVGQLSVSLVQTSGAAGSILGTIALANTASSACSLYGYPGLGLLDANGHGLPTTVKRGSSVVVPAITPRLVVLQPGARAAFLFGYSDIPTGSQSCPTASKLEVTPPNDYGHATIAMRLAPCGGVITVSPVFPGVHPPAS